MSAQDTTQNPLNPATVSTENGTCELSDVLDLVIHKGALDLRVCLPAAIVAVDGNQQVDVQPLLKARYVGAETATSMRVITQIPVSMPMGKDWAVRFPIAVGDIGYIICADRSLDTWLAGDGSECETGDTRTHTLQDAIFVPGLTPFAKQSQFTHSDLLLINGQAQIALQKTGKFKVANQGQELVDLIGQLTSSLIALTQALASAQVITTTGPATFSPSTQVGLQNELAQAQGILTHLKTLQGV